MSRGGALGKTLQLPPGVAAEVTAVKPSGDCFYDCLHLLLRHPSEERIPASLRSSQAMRAAPGRVLAVIWPIAIRRSPAMLVARFLTLG